MIYPNILILKGIILLKVDAMIFFKNIYLKLDVTQNWIAQKIKAFHQEWWTKTSSQIIMEFILPPIQEFISMFVDNFSSKSCSETCSSIDKYMELAYEKCCCL